jgi:hypothetical protein
MLDFTLEPPRFFLINENISHTHEVKTARSPVDRRAASAADCAPPISPKRRRDDGLNRAKRAPLDW